MFRRARLLGLIVCALSGARVSAQAPEGSRGPELARAQELIRDVRYADAATLIDATLAQGSLTREALIELCELQGIVQASLGDKGRALAAYKKLLALDREHALPRGLSPKVLAQFTKAQEWLAHAGALKFEASAGGLRGSLTLRAKVSNDPLSLASRIRFRFREGDGPWQTNDLPQVSEEATLVSPAERLEWYAELLDQRENVLAHAGSASMPFSATRGAEAACADGSARGTDGSCTQLTAARAGPASRAYLAVGLGLLAAGALGAGVGIPFGLASNAARNEFNSPTLGPDGAVTSFTERRAAELAATAQGQAVLANTLFGVGAALAATGAAVLLFGGSSTVAVAPTADGVQLLGRF